VSSLRRRATCPTRGSWPSFSERPNKPGSLPTALQDIVRKDKDITIKEDWNRQNITVFMCGPNSTLTVIYRGSGGAFDKDTVSGVLAALKDSCRIYICLTKNDERVAEDWL
jgi:hypothetical protein